MSLEAEKSSWANFGITILTISMKIQQTKYWRLQTKCLAVWRIDCLREFSESIKTTFVMQWKFSMNTSSIKFLPRNKAIALLPPRGMSHEEFIHAIRDLGIQRLTEQAIRDKLRSAKFTYGCGDDGARGVTYFGVWKNGQDHDFVTICAQNEESPLQLAGTTLHELAHCLAGSSAGHDKAWKDACHQLGLEHAEAGGQAYELSHFSTDIQAALDRLTHPNDGTPTFGRYSGSLAVATKIKPCPLGIGTRGGKSRGKGSGSRLRKYTCDCGQIIRASTDNLEAHCDRCGSSFNRENGSRDIRAPAQYSAGTSVSLAA
jgi:hypothetical protein